MEKLSKNIHQTRKVIRNLQLVDSSRNFVEFLSICAIIIISASVFSLTSLIKSSRVLLSSSQAEVINSTGAILTTPTTEELKQYSLIQNLFAKLPLGKNSFVIDFDFSKDKFRVLLTEPYDTSRANFDTWKTSNYNDLNLDNFSFENFAPTHNGPYLLTNHPYYSEVGKTLTFTTLLYDTNGSTDIDSVYFGLTTCDRSQAASGYSEFERRFSNYFGASFKPGTNTGSVATKNPSQGCSNTAGNSPWTSFSDASNINLSNSPNSAKLISISKSNLGKILKVSWTVNLATNFIPSNFAKYNYYFMAKDKSGLWNTATTTPKWNYSGSVNLKNSGSTTASPTPNPTGPVVTSSPTPTPASSGTIDILPIADAFVNDKYPDVNNGSDTLLKTLSSPIKITYLKFDLSTLAGKTISKAVLRIMISDASADTQNVKRVGTNSWSEGTITFNNKPSLGTVITTFNNSVSGSYKEVDITNFVNNNKGNVVSIALNTSGTNELNFYSKEYSTSSARPRIRVQ